jgi:hypothetical protein
MTTAVDVGFLSLALCFNTLTAPAVKITQEADGSYAYNKYSIYFIAELIKLTVAGGTSVYLYNTDKEMQRVMKVTTRDIWQYVFESLAHPSSSGCTVAHTSRSVLKKTF